MCDYTPFLLTAIIVLVVPGPAVMFIVARSIEHGSKAGAVSTLGIASGGMAHVMFAGFGLSAMLAASANALDTVRLVGAAYLIYLGVVALLGNSNSPRLDGESDVNLRRVYCQGVLVQLLNPKAALFFLAFLPQFVEPERGSVLIQLLTLGILFVMMGFVTDMIYALLAGSIRMFTMRSRRMGIARRWASGFTYISLGVAAALSTSKRM